MSYLKAVKVNELSREKVTAILTGRKEVYDWMSFGFVTSACSRPCVSWTHSTTIQSKEGKEMQDEDLLYIALLKKSND